jgi:hypothetical protein
MLLRLPYIFLNNRLEHSLGLAEKESSQSQGHRVESMRQLMDRIEEESLAVELVSFVR